MNKEAAIKLISILYVNTVICEELQGRNGAAILRERLEEVGINEENLTAAALEVEKLVTEEELDEYLFENAVIEYVEAAKELVELAKGAATNE